MWPQKFSAATGSYHRSQSARNGIYKNPPEENRVTVQNEWTIEPERSGYMYKNCFAFSTKMVHGTVTIYCGFDKNEQHVVVELYFKYQEFFQLD